jgi:ABC-2 type transport system permease protein
MKKIRTVLGFEYRGYIKSKSFIIVTVIFVAVILIASQIPRFMGALDDIGSVIGGDEKQKALIELTGAATDEDFMALLSAKTLNEATGGMYEWSVHGEDGKGAAAATDPKGAIREEMYDVVVVYGGGEGYKLYGKAQDFALDGLLSALDAVFTGAAREVKMSGLTAEEQSGVRGILGTAVAGEVETVGGGEAGNNFWLSYVMLYVLFMTIMMYGQFIVSAVINEKSSKMMELLVTSARPTELRFGKVFGVAMAVFTQIGAIAAAVGAAFASNIGTWEKHIPGFRDMLSSINISAGLFIFFLLFFVTGYFLYAFICAAVGSTASRVEDAGSVSTLPMMLATVSFVVSMLSMSNIDAAYVGVLSYIPFFSPWIMVARLCMASATFGEAAVSLAILAASVIFFGWLAAKVYRIGVMMYGKPMKLTAVVKAALRA